MLGNKSILSSITFRCGRLLFTITITANLLLSACSTTPLLPYTEDSPPLVLMPASQAGIEDKRGRFREIYCAVLEQHGQALPDYLPCEQALTRVGIEPEGSGKIVKLGSSSRNLQAVLVPGIGSSCFSNWLKPKSTAATHIRQFGYEMVTLKVDALSSSSNNARQIRDAIMIMEHDERAPKLVLIGYSKGAVDILEAIVTYPEIRKHVAAVISAAGSIGGSALANDVTQSELNLVRHWPDAKCTPGDGGAIDSLRPSARQAWLSENRLPRDFPYYSLVTYPKPERISSILKSSYDKLSQIDARNDSQIIFYDQVIPGSALIGYLNADHWALSVPVARTHSTIGSIFVDQNNYPREALLEALMRFVEEDLSTSVKD
jgi:hypothetical protein